MLRARASGHDCRSDGAGTRGPLAPAGMAGATRQPAAWAGQSWPADRAADRGLSGRHCRLGEYERRRREAEARLLALEQQEQELLADAERHSETVMLATHADVFCRRVRDGLAAAGFERKRALLELLVDRVVVTGSAVEIRYVFPTGPEGEREPFCRLRTDYLYTVPSG